MILKHDDVKIPLLCDSHMHLVEYGKYLMQVDLRGCQSIKEMVETLKNKAEGRRIEAFGWNQETFVEKRYPTRDDLDQIANDRPVILSRVCGHITVVNSYVIDHLNLNFKVPHIEGGAIDLDASGRPTGIFRENARRLIKEAGFYDETPANIKTYILKAQEDLLSKGIGEVHTDCLQAAPNLTPEDILMVYHTLETEGDLHLKVVHQANTEDLETLKKWQKTLGALVDIGSVKIFTDGSLGARTAWLREAYSDDPTSYGIATLSESDLQKRIDKAFDAGFPVSIHAIGDGAIDKVLTVLENRRQDVDLLRASGIIHCQVTSEDLLQRILSLGIRVYVQPLFLHEDAKIVYARLGNKRAETSYVWSTMYEMGIPLWFGSDAPIESPDVIQGLYCAVTRQTLDQPPLVYLPHEAMTVEKALSCYVTKDPTLEGFVTLDRPLQACLQTPLSHHIQSVTLAGKVFMR